MIMAGPSRKIWGFELAVVVVGLLAIAQQSMQLGSNHPMHGIIQRINSNGPYIGLVLVSDNNEQALLDSNAFTQAEDQISSVELAGRKFKIGTIKGNGVIYVKTGESSVNAAQTVQILLASFDIKGIVHVGSAGAVNDSLSIGDVVVPKKVAFTGIWKWLKDGAKGGQLVFSDYNYPEGDNSLGSISFQPTTLYATGKNKTTIFWLPLNSAWFDTASQLENVELQQCISTKKCLPRAPVIAKGLSSSTADIYVQNAAIREFIYTHLKASTVDEETAAVTLVALSNGVENIIVFRGISNTAGGSTAYKSYSYLGSVNAVNVAVEFIGAVGTSKASIAAY
ncbi:hypothetical protein P3X46_005207 [Hevea brasiliensis]|uniref:Nucleoside phosphorylase domain-containing protein n=1 Tax=Hevea brasiliensis TaxID=3981 RepID=A0ABQ9N0Z6_HEVBR|nr:bark storage protein A [Hevea brasiliensis]KAJ9185595.1 hypothetical protein P3X46_005207 [Hevea brasiliensis]